MLVIVAGKDRYLRETITELVQAQGLRAIRSYSVERVLAEMKKPGRLAIIDINWEDIQQRGVLRQIVNIGKISGNKVICICPNQEEDLKKLARSSRADSVFIRYELTTAFKEYLQENL